MRNPDKPGPRKRAPGGGRKPRLIEGERLDLNMPVSVYVPASWKRTLRERYPGRQVSEYIRGLIDADMQRWDAMAFADHDGSEAILTAEQCKALEEGL